jgi:hypothetical protein
MPPGLTQEHQAYLLQQRRQGLVPVQALDQAVQIGQHHLRADALDAMDAADEGHGRALRPGRAQLHADHRPALAAAAHLAQDFGTQLAAAAADQAAQLQQFGQGFRILHQPAIIGRQDDRILSAG